MAGPMNPITGREELVVPPTLLGPDAGALSVSDLSGQTAVFAQLELAYVGNRAFLSGTDLVQNSGDYGSAILKLAGTLSMAAGGFEGIDLRLDSSGAFTVAGTGVIGVKCLVTNTASLVQGEIYGGQFKARHNSDDVMTAQASLVGLEGIGYCAGDGGVGVMIGVSAVIRSYSISAHVGYVHRGIQIVVDEPTLGADEVTGLCIWNMGASAIDAFRIAGADTMANFLYVDASGGLLGVGSLKNSDNTDIKCDDYLVVSLGGSPRYIPLYDTKN